jgi:hypothetical protein
MAGLSYVLMMHFGNDVIYFKREDQQKIYKAVKDAIMVRVKAAP